MKIILSLIPILSFLLLPRMSFAAGDPAMGAGLVDEIKCEKCHRFTDQKFIGPGLKGVTKRRSEQWLKKWLTNPQATWEENDAETQKLKQWSEGRAEAAKTRMKIRSLSPEEVDHLIAYLRLNDEG